MVCSPPSAFLGWCMNVDMSDALSAESATEASLTELNEEIERFAEWANTMPGIIAANSLIAELDNYFQPLHTTFRQLVQLPTIAAVDNLRLAVTAMRNHDSQPPFAIATLLRAAGTSASIALWLLADEDSDRQLRALKLLCKDYSDYLNFLSTCSTATWVDDEAHQHAFRSRTEITERLRQSGRMITQLTPNDQAERNKSNEFGDLKVVTDSSTRVGAILSDPQFPADALLWHWQKASGAVHARQWATLIWVDRRPEANEAGTTTHSRLTGDLTDLLDAAWLTQAIVRAIRLRYLALAGQTEQEET